MKRIMIIGSGYNFCSLVGSAKKNGMYVIVCDGQTNGPARELADAFYEVDIMDYQLMRGIAQENNVDGIITSFSDITIIPYVHLTNELGYPSLCNEEQLKWFLDKAQMKKRFELGDIPTSRYQTIREDEISTIKLEYPIIAKPCRGSGSKGIYIVENARELKHYFKEIQQKGNFVDETIVVEEYKRGSEILVQAWIEKGQVYLYHIGDREMLHLYEGKPGQTRCNIFPSRYMKTHKEQIEIIMNKIVHCFDIAYGIISLQAIIDREGNLFVIEVMPRLTGGQDHLIQKQKSGVDLCEILVKYAVGDVSYKETLKQLEIQCLSDEYYFFIPIICNKGKISKILLDEALEKDYVTYIDLQAQVGDEVQDSQDMRQIKARIHGVGSSWKEVLERSDEIRKSARIIDDYGKNMVMQRSEVNEN